MMPTACLCILTYLSLRLLLLLLYAYAADVFDGKTWSKELEGASGVVSCIGAFGSEAFMEKINGDANIHAVETAAKAGKALPKDSFVTSSHIQPSMHWH